MVNKSSTLSLGISRILASLTEALMLDQNLFSPVLEDVMKAGPIPLLTAEVYSVDEVTAPEFEKVFGHGSVYQECRGLQIYGVA